MSGWGDFTNFASSALKNAQKKIDKVLDIKEDEVDGAAAEAASSAVDSVDDPDATPLINTVTVAKLQEDFFSAFGLTAGGGSKQEDEPTESESKPSEESSSTLVLDPADEENVTQPVVQEEEVEMNEGAVNKPLNISKWLMGGSTVESNPENISQDELPPISPREKSSSKRIKKNSASKSGNKKLGAKKVGSTVPITVDQLASETADDQQQQRGSKSKKNNHQGKKEKPTAVDDPTKKETTTPSSTLTTPPKSAKVMIAASATTSGLNIEESTEEELIQTELIAAASSVEPLSLPPPPTALSKSLSSENNNKRPGGDNEQQHEQQEHPALLIPPPPTASSFSTTTLAINHEPPESSASAATNLLQESTNPSNSKTIKSTNEGIIDQGGGEGGWDEGDWTTSTQMEISLLDKQEQQTTEPLKTSKPTDVDDVQLLTEVLTSVTSLDTTGGGSSEDQSMVTVVENNMEEHQQHYSSSTPPPPGTSMFSDISDASLYADNDNNEGAAGPHRLSLADEMMEAQESDLLGEVLGDDEAAGEDDNEVGEKDKTPVGDEDQNYEELEIDRTTAGGPVEKEEEERKVKVTEIIRVDTGEALDCQTDESGQIPLTPKSKATTDDNSPQTGNNDGNSPNVSEEVKTPSGSTDNGSGSDLGSENLGLENESSSVAESYVKLEPGEGSPPLGTLKSETSSIVVKGSGYTSPTDEIETVASSDIEIISTTNGDNMSERSGIVMVSSSTKACAGGSSTNKSGSMDWDKMSHRRTASDATSVQKLTDALEQRQKKIMEMSTELMHLADENEQMRAELTGYKHIKADNESLGKALKTLEDKFAKVSEEKDKYRRTVEKLEKSSGSSTATAAQLEKRLLEKEEQIADFVREGEKLSQKELKQSNIIKKLREKEKATEKTIEAQKVKLNEMEDLRQKLKDKKEQEIKYDEAVHQLKSTTEKQDKVIKRMEKELIETKDRLASQKETLDSTYTQIAELTREKVAKESQISKLHSEAEASQEEALRSQLAEAEKNRNIEKSDLARQVEELQLSLMQASEDADRRQAAMKWDVEQLQKKLADSENRNQELSEGMGSATAPLLRQIESLQASHSAQQSNWERLEQALYDRIHDSEKKTLEAQEKERAATNIMMDLRSELLKSKAGLESANEDKAACTHKMEDMKRSIEKLTDAKKMYNIDLDNIKKHHVDQVEDLKKEKELLAKQFEMDKKKWKKDLDDKIADLLRQLDEKESVISSLRNQLLESARMAASSTTPSSRPLPEPRPSSPSSSSIMSFNYEENNEMDIWGVSDISGVKYGSLVEKLREKLQQRDGEMAVLREELRQVQQSRDNMTNQVASMSHQQEDMIQKVGHMEILEDKYRELESKQQALLQMYGEKVEQNEELRLDLDDMKTMYRQQIQDLLQQK